MTLRIKCWPAGQHLNPPGRTLTLEEQMTLQQSIDLAEVEADIAYEKYNQASEADEHPEIISQLNVEATIARHRYYDALNADLAL